MTIAGDNKPSATHQASICQGVFKRSQSGDAYCSEAVSSGYVTAVLAGIANELLEEGSAL